jgi:hypothetical protein
MAPFIACEKHGGQLYPEGGKCPVCVKQGDKKTPVTNSTPLPSGTQTF